MPHVANCRARQGWDFFPQPLFSAPCGIVWARVCPHSIGRLRNPFYPSLSPRSTSVVKPRRDPAESALYGPLGAPAFILRRSLPRRASRATRHEMRPTYRGWRARCSVLRCAGTGPARQDAREPGASSLKRVVGAVDKFRR